jgi:hypothetical protein
MSDQFEGGCLLSAVRFVVIGQPKWVSWCHCQSVGSKAARHVDKNKAYLTGCL